MVIMIRQKVLAEIELIPEDKLSELYQVLHYFRIGLEQTNLSKSERVLAFAGSWGDMSEASFDELMQEIGDRRTDAFKRRSSEGSLNESFTT